MCLVLGIVFILIFDHLYGKIMQTILSPKIRYLNYALPNKKISCRVKKYPSIVKNS